MLAGDAALVPDPGQQLRQPWFAVRAKAARSMTKKDAGKVKHKGKKVKNAAKH